MMKYVNNKKTWIVLFLAFLAGYFILSYGNLAKTGHCLLVENKMPPDLDMPGKIIVFKGNEYTALSQSGYAPSVFPQNMTLLDTSPDRKKMIFIGPTNVGVPPTHLFIVNSSGEILRSFAWDASWAQNFPVRWLDNNTISMHTWPVGSIVALKVDNSEQQNVSFPQMDEILHDYLPTGNYDFVEYSSTLDRVIYRSWSQIFIVRSNSTFGWTVMWAKGTAGDFAKPVWSVDGSMVAVPVQDDNAVEFQGQMEDFYSGIENIYLVQYGDDKRLTDFKEMYWNPYRVKVDEIAWSLDSSRFALKLVVKKKAKDSFDYIDNRVAGRLLVIEPATEQVIDYCLLYSHSPVWSPDGKFIAIDGVVVDLERQRAYKITDDFIVGWMVGDNK